MIKALFVFLLVFLAALAVGGVTAALCGYAVGSPVWVLIFILSAWAGILCGLTVAEEYL